jgi:UDP-N-acetylmuramoylalanine--D-glutamate ligase
MDEYFADKAAIFRYQRAGDTLVIGGSIEKRVRMAKPPVEPLIPSALAPDWLLRVPGEHNQENASLAAAALLSLGLNAEQIRTGLESFEGVEGRLQLVGEKNGVTIYNDNNATTPEATIAALRALGGKPLILIAGGADKGLDTRGLLEEIRAHCKAVILLAGTGTDHIKKELHTSSIYSVLTDAVDAALSVAEKGDTLLFSPAFASFGMFKNEYDRNDQFISAVRAHGIV